MYFSLLPDIKYDTKPISYPFSESDFVTAKNFFRRYKISEDIFGHATFYKKYTLQEGVKIEQIANAYYGDVFYDWVVLLTNNIINPQFGLPLDSETLRKIVEEKYGEDEAYSGIHHYETIFTLSPQKVDGIHIPVLDGGTIVDKNFYDSPFSYWNGAETVTTPGNTVSKPILNFDYEVAENEKKREIYILRKDYFYRFIEEFKQGALYSRSSDFINKRLKKTSV